MILSVSASLEWNVCFTRSRMEASSIGSNCWPAKNVTSVCVVPISSGTSEEIAGPRDRTDSPATFCHPPLRRIVRRPRLCTMRSTGKLLQFGRLIRFQTNFREKCFGGFVSGIARHAVERYTAFHHRAMEQAFGGRHPEQGETLAPPPDWPKIVTFAGSPPKLEMLSRTHSSAATMSSMPTLLEFANCAPPRSARYR